MKKIFATLIVLSMLSVNIFADENHNGKNGGLGNDVLDTTTMEINNE